VRSVEREAQSKVRSVERNVHTAEEAQSKVRFVERNVHTAATGLPLLACVLRSSNSRGGGGAEQGAFC
jgi:hypothetical protein